MEITDVIMGLFSPQRIEEDVFLGSVDRGCLRRLMDEIVYKGVPETDLKTRHTLAYDFLGKLKPDMKKHEKREPRSVEDTISMIKRLEISIAVHAYRNPESVMWLGTEELI